MPLDTRGHGAFHQDIQSEQNLKTPRLEDALIRSYDYFWNTGVGHTFYRDGAGSVHVRSFIEERNKSLLVILPGRGESSLKYAELALELKGHGLDILIIDHRGQGFSERLNGVSDLVHVENFDDYVGDLDTIYNHFLGLKKYKTKIALAHSMGSAIVLRHIQIKGDGAWDGVLLSSPMLKIKSKTVPLFIAMWIINFYIAIGKKLKPVWTREVQDSYRAFEGNAITHCFHRFAWSRKMEDLHPHIMTGAPTIQWLRESILAGRRIARDKSSFKRPMLLIQADEDSVVCNEAQNKFAHEVENCRIIRLKECRHEVLQEQNSVRNRALVQIIQFLKNLS